MELDLLSGQEWGRKLGAEKLSASADEVFERLRDQARGRDFTLAAEKYYSARPAS
jgi:hypothetical protein